MNILLDSCVLLDCLTGQGKFFANTRKLFLLAVSKECTLWLSALQIPDMYYLLSRGNNPSFTRDAKKKLQVLMRSVHVCSVGGIEIDAALESSEESLELALLCQAAGKLKADCIITDGIKACKESPIPVFDPNAFFDWFKAEHNIDYAEIAF